MKKRKRKVLIVMIIILFMAGLLTLLYPFFSNWYFSRTIATKIENEELKYRDMTVEDVNREFGRAHEYNEAVRFAGKNINDTEEENTILDEYNEILNIDEKMCVLEIPKINVKLPVFHGVEEGVLKKGIGHIKETSLPVGGEGTHSYLTGHTGFARAKLFSDIDELQIGDWFYIDVLEERLGYRVDEINVVAAEEFSEVEITENGDFITLVTCTPEGINTHRLLVRGARVLDIPIIPDNEENVKNDLEVMIVLLVFIIICVIMIIITIRKLYKFHMGERFTST